MDIRTILHRYFIVSLGYMALGLFSSLIVGLILKSFGELLNSAFLTQIGGLSISMTGAAIGATMAVGLGARPLVLAACVLVGQMGFDTFSGGAIGAFTSVLFVIESARLYAGKTHFDIVLTPLLALLSGGLVAKVVALPLAQMTLTLGDLVLFASQTSPALSAILVAVLFGLTLTAPISSAALAIMIGLDGVPAAAATIGCACQMMGFFVMSIKDNGAPKSLASAFGTSMIFLPNIMRNPRIWIPPTLAGALIAPIMALYFPMQNNSGGAGMGTSALVGQLMTLEKMGISAHTIALIVVFHIALPILLTGAIYAVFCKKGWIMPGDLVLMEHK